MNIAQSKAILITSILEKMGYKPVGKSGRRITYHSPLHKDRTASLSVNTALNRYTDFGRDMRSGDTLDFVKALTQNEDTSHALAWLENFMGTGTVPPPPVFEGVDEEERCKIKFSVKPLECHILLQYLAGRGITRDVATRYCQEIWYSYPWSKQSMFGVAFPTCSEKSFETRNSIGKRCIGPKEISFIRIHKDRSTSGCCVFEGFMDFLSYVILYREHHPLAQTHLCDCIILNSVSCLYKALPEMRGYETIHCYLDNDKAGHETVEKIKAEFPRAVVDESHRYEAVNDVNDYLLTIRKLKTKNE